MMGIIDGPVSPCAVSVKQTSSVLAKPSTEPLLNVSPFPRPGMTEDKHYRNGGFRSLASRLDWVVYYQGDDSSMPTSTIAPTTPGAQGQLNKGVRELKESQGNEVPNRSFTFFVPTKIAPQSPMAPDTGYDSWYGRSSLGTLLAAREREIEGTAKEAREKESGSKKKNR